MEIVKHRILKLCIICHDFISLDKCPDQICEKCAKQKAEELKKAKNEE